MFKLFISLIIFVLSTFSFSQDRQEGWIVKETESGLIKVPKKQYFNFSGLDINGQVYTPGQGVLEQRPSRQNRSLIPVRKTFKKEALEAIGYPGGN